jgi:uncharacterized membrane protein
MPELMREPAQTSTPEAVAAPQSAWLDSLRPVIVVWTLAFLLRAAALLIGLDRLPLTPTVIDEVIINDPAVALSRGDGLVAFSFDHSPSGLDRLYGHFPPAFIALQALVFRIFGFSVFTLRASSVFFDLAACVVFLAILLELRRRRLAETWAIALAGVLVMLEPTALVHSRQGRMESLVVFLGGLALYLAIRAERSRRHEKPLWIAGSIAVGLALCTHFAALMMWAAFAVWSVRRFQRLGPALWLTVNSLPAVVLLFVWGITYRQKALVAFRQMHSIAAFSPGPSLRLGDLVSSIAARDFRAVVSTSGGPALLCALAVLLFASWRLWTTRSVPPAEAPRDWRSTLGGLGAILATQGLLLEFVVPNSGWSRILLAVPFAFVCLSVAVSYLPRRQWRTLAAGALVFVAAAQIFTIGFYLEQLRQDWTARSPERFDAILNSIPDNARVAAVPQLWYAFVERQHRVTLLYSQLNEDYYFLEAPNAFDEFDYVILSPAAPDYPQMLAKAQAEHPVQPLFQTFKGDFVVLARSRLRNAEPSRQ